MQKRYRFDDGAEPNSAPTPSSPASPDSTTIAVTPPAGEGIYVSAHNLNDNHIYLYEEINYYSSYNIIRSLRSVEAHFQKEMIDRTEEWGTPLPPIWLHIQSGGGDMFSSLAIADQIKSMKAPVYSIIEGYAASGATLVSMACKKRYMYPSSFIMIHQLSTAHWGTHEEFKDEMILQEMAMKIMAKFYSKNSNLKKKKVRKMLKHDSWYNAKKAKAKGFIDHIIGEV